MTPMAEDSDQAWMLLVVQRCKALAVDIVEFEFARADRSELPAFEPGAHLTVRTPAGRLRKYSLVNPPGERNRYVIAVRRDAQGTGGSVSMVDHLKAGTTLEVSMPDNAFPLTSAAKRVIFIAGGIGITPIIGMIRHLQSLEAQVEVAAPYKLIYLTRSIEDTAYREEVQGEALRTRVTLHHDHGDAARACDLWPILERPAAGTHVYCCGPRGLMDAVRDMTGHWAPSSIHFESFGAGDAALFEPNRPFTIRLARSGRSIEVAADQTALEAMRAHGCRVLSSCEAGSCGSCRTTYVAGDVEHRDLVLGVGEKANQIMVCVSRARGGVLELDL